MQKKPYLMLLPCNRGCNLPRRWKTYRYSTAVCDELPVFEVCVSLLLLQWRYLMQKECEMRLMIIGARGGCLFIEGVLVGLREGKD